YPRHSLDVSLLLCILRPPPNPTLFPYTTLFRSRNLTNPYQRAPISPYVNLVTGPGTITRNYFGITQPQQQDIAVQNQLGLAVTADRKSTRLNSSHVAISYAVFCLKKKTRNTNKN